MPPDNRIVAVLDPEDAFENAEFLREQTIEDPTRLFVTITPGADNVRSVGNDLLKALGKDSNVTGAGRSGTDTWLWAQLWLEVSEVQELFVSRAHLLSNWLLEQVASAAVRAGTRPWLIFQLEHLGRHHERFLSNWPSRRLTVAQMRAALSSARPARDQQSAPALSAERLPEVPVDDFTSFRASARTLLSAEDFARVDATFREAFAPSTRYFADCGQPSEDDVCTHLRTLIADERWLSETLTRLRASQVAAFHAGYLMKVNLDVIAATRTQRVRWNEESEAVLSRYGAPRYAAAAALLICLGAEVRELLAMNLSDVSDDGREVTVSGRRHTLRDGAARMVAAAVHERLTVFAAPDDPLFVYIKGTGNRSGAIERWTSRGFYDAVKWMERESRLLLTAHLADGGQRTAVSWARRRGVSIQKI